jgi:hypothetical protein
LAKSRLGAPHSVLAVVFLVAGCSGGLYPDPNDVAEAGPKTPVVIQNQLRSAADYLNDRKAKGELSNRGYAALMAKIARDYIAQAKDQTITKENASLWGDVYVSARDWQHAEPALEVAVKAEKLPAGEDYIVLGRYITDTLRLARVKAELGKVRDAIQIVRTTFAHPGKAKAPILPAVLYEIVPAGQGKGHDLELADLLKDSVAQHEGVIIDPNTDAGRNFLLARPHHIERAWAQAALLYGSAGRPDLAQDALKHARQTAGSTTRL